MIQFYCFEEYDFFQLFKFFIHLFIKIIKKENNIINYLISKLTPNKKHIILKLKTDSELFNN